MAEQGFAIAAWPGPGMNIDTSHPVKSQPAVRSSVISSVVEYKCPKRGGAFIAGKNAGVLSRTHNFFFFYETTFLKNS